MHPKTTILSLSQALELHFPCGGCARYLGTDEHLAICPVKYRGRATEMARALGLA